MIHSEDTVREVWRATRPWVGLEWFLERFWGVFTGLHVELRRYRRFLAIDRSAADSESISKNLGNTQVEYDKFNHIENVVDDRDQDRKPLSGLGAGKRRQLVRTR